MKIKYANRTLKIYIYMQLAHWDLLMYILRKNVQIPVYSFAPIKLFNRMNLPNLTLNRSFNNSLI